MTRVVLVAAAVAGGVGLLLAVLQPAPAACAIMVLDELCVRLPLGCSGPTGIFPAC